MFSIAREDFKHWYGQRSYMSYTRFLLNGEISVIENSYGNHRWLEDDLKVYKMMESKKEINLSMCEQELIDLTDKQFDKYLYDFLNRHTSPFTEKKDHNKMTILLHFLHLFSVPGQEKKKNQVLRILTCQLAQMSENDLYSMYNEYLDQLLTRKSIVTEEDLCIREIDPYYELQLKLCYSEKLIKQEKYQIYKELINQNVDFFISMSQRMKTRKDYKTMFKTCKFFAHVIDIDTLWHLPGQLKNQEDLLPCLLSELLSMLQEVNSKMKDPYFELLYQLFLCRKQINENEGDADVNIITKCLNNFNRKKFRENQGEFIALIISITDILLENSFLKKLLQRFLRQRLQTVSSTATTSLPYNKESKWNEIFKYTDEKMKKNLIYAQCACIVSGKRMRNVDTNQYLRKLNIKGPDDESEAETQSEQEKLLMLFIILLLVTTLGHKSAKLKKCLALKYEYDMASLYLLWCSGDIEVHPGPSWIKKQLEHNSEIMRKWIPDITTILLKLYWEIPTQSKPKNLWQRKPEHWPSDKPFHDTKSASKNTPGQKVSDDERLTCLLECLEKKKVVIPETYQFEISAWSNRNIQLLHKLQVFRTEMENVKSATLNLFLPNLEEEVKSLEDIKVSLENSTLDKMQTEDLQKNDQRQKKQAEMVANITRDLASALCRLTRGIDPTKKSDGIWNHPPPVHWPEDVPFFNPYNRGNYKKKCSDSRLLDTFLKLPNLKIPKNLKGIVDAYQTMYNSTDTDGKKKNKDKLCRLYSIQSNKEKLDCSLQNVHKEGLYSREVHAILNQWWKTQSVDEYAEHVLKNATVRSNERPHITINITKEFEPDADLENISYTIPINNGYLRIQCTKVLPIQPSHGQTIQGSDTSANNQENAEERVKSPDIIRFLSDYDQTEFHDDKDTGPETSDSERQESTLSATQAYQKPQTMVDTLTTHNNQSSDINSNRFYIKYKTKGQQTSASDYNVNGSIVENLVIGNTGTSKVKKRKHLEDNEEAAKKLLKTKWNQNDGESLEPNPNSKSNYWKICSGNALDSWSLDFSLVDKSSANNVGALCECKNSEDIQSCQKISYLESQNQQYLLENIDKLKNYDNQNDQIEDDKELESFLDFDNYLSGKPSEMERLLSQ